MFGYILRRLLSAVPIAFGVSVVCFLLVYLAPGDPVQTLLPPDADAETVAQVKRMYGLDQPLPVQYLTWLGRVMVGDFGRSIATGRPVADEIFRSLGNTVLLAGLSVLVAFSIAFVLGTIAGRHAGGWLDRVVTGVAVVGVSVPNYWLGIVLVIIFSVEMMALPASGMGDGRFDPTSWEHVQYLILPVITLSMIPVGIIARTTRSAVSEVMNQEFVTTLRANGLPEWRVLRHALKNALPPVLAVMGLQFGTLMGGSILVETVFSWPGSGFLLSKAILTRDIPVLQGTILVLALIFVFTNLTVDLFQSSVDPRIRRA
ncbi:ABC transporter permease [Roseomonas aerophila]|jgi:peptide/nickel transport system permease protein|uniref:ABC transporter permease n=1 Tax=Teichococcus aerophilus TaxID=1224513 RepID=A0ABR7RLH3_9PROT|nr:ABC transporter permease [Pseudoroseomonas aerophila]MBC9207435.1 ABC transporter permease [Pseudoroseomonas aerophila]